MMLIKNSNLKQFLGVICALFFVIACSTLKNKATLRELHSPVYKNIGDINFKITSNSNLSEMFFNQGIAFFYGFNFVEAIRSFEAAIQEDPECVMCYWGLASSLGYKFNRYVDNNERASAIQAIETAYKYIDKVSKKEKELLIALSEKYSFTDVKAAPELISENTHKNKHSHHPEALNISDKELENYANKMYKLVKQFPEDDDIAVLYIMAMFDHKKWNFWDRDKKPTKKTHKMLKLLEQVLARDPKHIGAHHLYIHLLEPSPFPHKAVASAEILDELAPMNEHLVHMPSHIYFTMGDYYKAQTQNLKALEANRQFNLAAMLQNFDILINYNNLHNMHFLWTAAMLNGDGSLALKTAIDIQEKLNLNLFKHEPHFVDLANLENETYLQLGHWDKIINAKKLNLDNIYIDIYDSYAKFMAYAMLKDNNEALKYHKKFKSLFSSLAGDNIHFEMLNEVVNAKHAEINFKYNDVIKHLKFAANIENNVGNEDPPLWIITAKRSLGAALLKYGQYDEAIQVFTEDLAHFRKNPWAYYGIAEAYKKLDQQENYQKFYTLFTESWQHSTCHAKPEYLFEF